MLSSAERVEETARMLGGVTITEQTRAHAKEMLAQGRSSDPNDAKPGKTKSRAGGSS